MIKRNKNKNITNISKKPVSLSTQSTRRYNLIVKDMKLLKVILLGCGGNFAYIHIKHNNDGNNNGKTIFFVKANSK
jgi:hypothetical protein